MRMRYSTRDDLGVSALRGARPTCDVRLMRDASADRGRLFVLLVAWLAIGIFGITEALGNGSGRRQIYHADGGLSHIDVVAHKSVVIELAEPFTKVLVADDTIADVCR